MSTPTSRRKLSRREFLGTAAASVSVSPSPSRERLPNELVQEKERDAARRSFSFPQGFLWGAGTSAYQVEGAANEDGRGRSIWDEFCDQPERIWSGHSGAIACDHYHRYREDVALMRSMGLRAYRFSISWPRVLPGGRGSVNARGLDFYKRLVDELLRAGIRPFATLHHWDLPQTLQQEGGWLQREAADWFAEYAGVVADALSDRVAHWLTFNEPRSFIGSAYRTGEHAPGLSIPLKQALQAAHHVLLAHGRAVQALRARGRQPLQIAYLPDASPSFPVAESGDNIAAARKATFEAPRESFHIENWWRTNAWWLDPVFLGEYPPEGLAALRGDAPEVRPDDLEVIRQPLDFFAVNIYGGYPVRAGADGRIERVPLPAGAPLTAFHWPVTPEALYWGPKFLFERYRQPILITENGLSCHDWLSLDGCAHDPQRVDFIARHLGQLVRAMREGVPVRGYFYWSFLDNFEWAQGYKQRFGLVHVDFATQKRTLKDSARWYARLIASNGASLSAEQQPACASP